MPLQVSVGRCDNLDESRLVAAFPPQVAVGRCDNLEIRYVAVIPQRISIGHCDASTNSVGRCDASTSFDCPPCYLDKFRLTAVITSMKFD